MEGRPSNPTPSRQFNIEQQHAIVQPVNNNNNNNNHANNINDNNKKNSTRMYTFESGKEKHTFKKQPSLSDLIKANLISVDGTDRGMSHTPSLSDLMDFEISPDDLLSETSSNNNNNRRNQNNNKNDDTSQIQTSPLAKARRSKHVPAVYQTWNDSKERRDRAYKHLQLDQFYKGDDNNDNNMISSSSPNNNKNKPKPRPPRRPASSNTYKFKGGISAVSSNREFSIQGRSPPRQDGKKINVTNENASHITEDHRFPPPRPKSPVPFEGRRSAWDRDGSESDSSSALSEHDDDNDYDHDNFGINNTKGLHYNSNNTETQSSTIHANLKVKLYIDPEKNNEKSMNDNKKKDLVNKKTSSSTSLSTAQIDRTSAKIIRLCLDEREDYILDSLDYAIHLFNRLIQRKVVLKLPGVYKHLILRCCREKKIVPALDIFNHMCDANVTVPVVVWENINSALLNAGMLEKCIGMISNMRWRKMVVKNGTYILFGSFC